MSMMVVMRQVDVCQRNGCRLADDWRLVVQAEDATSVAAVATRRVDS